MDKIYDHKKVEGKIYKTWEEKGYFKPEVNPEGEPFTIILPPPNANGALHFGHAMFTVEDILTRYHRMRGFAALWLPGTDHAGIETQFVFEKKLKAEGKSRLDFDQETLYKMIEEYVNEHRGGIQNQLRRLGFSLDWSREKYTLDPDIVALVYKTFKKMYDENLVYRDFKLVNYCTFDGTSFSDLEVVYEEKDDNIWYLKYPLEGEDKYVVVATTRPETMLGDTAVAVNPEDKRYKDLVGKTLVLPLVDRKIPVIADETVDMEFGTGAVKVTPAHDPADNERGKRHNLEEIMVIGYDGRMNENAGKYQGLYAKQARVQILEDLRNQGLLDKEEKIRHAVPVCYKCKNIIQPLLREQWFVKVKPLAERAIKAVQERKIKITPRNFENVYFQWLENLRDWNISRQIVWGIRIPAWFCEKCSNWTITDGTAPEKCSKCASKELSQDTDTFDTWFSSGQWPYLTLKTGKEGDFEKFYPTDVMETAYDILKAWVTRMVMLGLYLTDEVPFKNVLFHGIVNDPYGKKMSKSKGNVVNPLELVDQYGADAVRFALIYGNATGNDQALSYTKLDAARKFTNKLWNMARFIDMKREESKLEIEEISLGEAKSRVGNESDKEWIGKIEELAKEISRYIDSYQFNLAAERLYEFSWHEFADKYIEDVKNRIDKDSFAALYTMFATTLKLLHPFMPYVTEELYNKLGFEGMLIVSNWPTNES